MIECIESVELLLDKQPFYFSIGDLGCWWREIYRCI